MRLCSACAPRAARPMAERRAFHDELGRIVGRNEKRWVTVIAGGLSARISEVAVEGIAGPWRCPSLEQPRAIAESTRTM
eukprot:9183320-Alexandrium_andersonii.AAC.1